MRLGFISTRILTKAYLPRLVEFTLFQMLQHNIQLGASVRFSLLSSHWFIFGVYRNFSIINLSQTIVHYRHFLKVVRYVTDRARHVLFVNER
jgi:ribosomal protein S2